MVGWGEKKRKKMARNWCQTKAKNEVWKKKKNEVFGAFPKLLS